MLRWCEPVLGQEPDANSVQTEAEGRENGNQKNGKSKETTK
jgi:hypothetical protein